jgi:dienelactone hydrolase
MHRVIKVMGLAVLTTSLLLNIVLLTQLASLVPYYRAYWDIRSWISQNVLGRPGPDTRVIFQSDEFMLRPAPRPTPRFRLGDVLEVDDPYQLQAELRTAVVKAFALERVPRGDLGFITHSSETLPGYIRHKVSYQTQVGVRIPAYLLEPSEVPPSWPAVLVVHGCGYGKAGVVGLVPDMHNAIGVHLVQAGFLVLVPDRRGFGELQPVPNYVPPNCDGGRDGRYLLNADANAVFGTDLRSLDVFDLLIAVEYLAERTDVTAVGVAGLSGGGVVAEYVAGLSDNVQAVVLANSMSLPPQLAEQAEPERESQSERRFPTLAETPADILAAGCPCEIEALSTLADQRILVLLALLPPVPVLIQYGDSDTVNYLKGGPQAIQFLRQLYALYGAEGFVSVSIEPGGHEFFPEAVIQFFHEQLRK